MILMQSNEIIVLAYGRGGSGEIVLFWGGKYSKVPKFRILRI